MYQAYNNLLHQEKLITTKAKREYGKVQTMKKKKDFSFRKKKKHIKNSFFRNTLINNHPKIVYNRNIFFTFSISP